MSDPTQRPSGAPARSLGVGVVVFRPDWARLETTVATLLRAVAAARMQGVLGRVTLWLVDNGSDAQRWARFVASVRESAAVAEVAVEALTGHGNPGFGAGHNLALRASHADLHLVLNPDVELEPDALVAGVRCLDAHPRAVLVAPAVVERDGRAGHLCRRYPSVLDLALRGFAPRWLRRAFRQRLARYELSDLAAGAAAPVPLCSGAFMLARGAALRAVDGFDERFFLYFEDYDLSLRLAREGDLMLCPAMRVRHHGGGASGKGAGHLGLFAVSAWKFFRRHGWRWV